MKPSDFLRRLPNAAPLTYLADGARTLVLHFRHHPTVDYYWRSRYPDALIVDTSITRPYFINLGDFDQTVIVRHIKSDWLTYLCRTKRHQKRVIYFLDDDIPGLFPDGFLPLRYAFKNRYRYLRSLKILDRLCDAVCVSTPALAERYALPSRSVVEPLPWRDDLLQTEHDRPQKAATPLIFYHGTGSHLRETVWLRPVIKGVIERVPTARFELIGGKHVQRMFANLEHVRVLRQMSWHNYLDHCHSRSFDVGLAPLLPSRFNSVRSHVKFFDITRCGAAGIYSNRPPFEGNVQSGVNGLLVDDSEDEWINAIVALATDEIRRKQISENAASYIQQRIKSQ